MSYYDWPKIIESKSDDDLLSIFKNRHSEPFDKIDAVIIELRKRNLLSDNDEKLIEKPNTYDVILEANKVKDTRPNNNRSRITQIFILLVLLFNIISLLSAIMQYNLIKAFQNGAYITNEMLSGNDLRQKIIGIVSSAVFISSGIIFIFWFRRAYYNLHQRFADCKYDEGWAAGGWFVPVISLYYPYQIMKELWVKSSQIITKRKGEDMKKSNLTLLISWWTLWLVVNFLSNIILKSIFKENTISNLITTTELDIISSILDIPLAIITFIIIKKLSEKEEILYREEKNEAGI